MERYNKANNSSSTHLLSGMDLEMINQINLTNALDNIHISTRAGRNPTDEELISMAPTSAEISSMDEELEVFSSDEIIELDDDYDTRSIHSSTYTSFINI